MLGKSPIFPLKLHFWYPTYMEISLMHHAQQCAVMYDPFISPYSMHILAGKTEELYALCRQETVFSATTINPAGTRSTNVCFD